jgi:hypothetical protein
MFLPLASFSAVGNIANLYVYFMTASAVFLYYRETTPAQAIYKSVVLFIAAASLPLTIFLLPMMLHRIYLDKKSGGSRRILKSDFIFLVGITVQLAFIALTSLGERVPNSPQSLYKTLYLYFERGIGISIIPKWGFISGSSGNIKYENSAYLLHSTNTRLLVLMVTLVTLVFLFYKKRFGMTSLVREQSLFIIFLGFMYSMIVGLFFNPEPRYMIFTSFLTLWVILLFLESQGKSKFRDVLNIYIIMVLLFGLTASIHRSQGPDWKPEVAKSRQFCTEMPNERQVKIRTLPMDANFVIVIPCEKLR